jgi:hypothetical protein
MDAELDALHCALKKIFGLRHLSVKVNVELMEVTLEGTAISFYYKQQAGEAAIQMKCWHKINNRLQVP